MTTKGEIAIKKGGHAHQVMAGILNTFPQEPWERGFAALCLEPSLTVFNFTDSFGEIYGYNPSNIACGVYATAPSVFIPAQAHKHPYITSAAQYNRGLGCNYPDPPLASEPSFAEWMFWMETAGATFSTGDINVVQASGKREYLRSALGDVVLRRDYNGNEVQVYP